MRRFPIDGSCMLGTPEGLYCQNMNDTSALTCRLGSQNPLPAQLFDSRLQYFWYFRACGIWRRVTGQPVHHVSTRCSDRIFRRRNDSRWIQM